MHVVNKGTGVFRVGPEFGFVGWRLEEWEIARKEDGRVMIKSDG